MSATRRLRGSGMRLGLLLWIRHNAVLPQWEDASNTWLVGVLLRDIGKGPSLILLLRLELSLPSALTI